ncbi:Sciellin [Apodemus speciosus]|uniref:Sciellin n=1 Tax=Apodemus speciosus TaxID=105296 RepID=A0ABQ0FJE0_APOSI
MSSLESSMSNFSSRKKSPTGNDPKSIREAALRQQGFHDVNKRRAFLQDNSWIKKRPEEEKDENYGRVVLSRHNSHDALDRKIMEREEPKATISRYRSEEMLDRTLSIFRTPESTKMPAGSSFNANSSATASTPASTPVKKKRQSWFPPPPPGHNASPSAGAIRRDPALHPPLPPKPRSPIASPEQLRQTNRQVPAATAGARGETYRHAERNIRAEDLDDIIRVATALQKTDKGEELDNLIRMNKSLNRNQGLDGLFRANLKAQQLDKRAQSLESLIYMNTQKDRDGKGQDRRSITRTNAVAERSSSRKKDLDELIEVNPDTNKPMKRGQSLDNLIKVTPEGNRSSKGGQSLDNFIKGVPARSRANPGNQDLDSLIKVTPSANKSNQRSLDELTNKSPKAVTATAGHQDLDKFIKVNPDVLTNNQRNHDLDSTIRGNPTVVRSNQSQDLDNLIKVRPSALQNANGPFLGEAVSQQTSWTGRDQDPESLTEVNSHVSKEKNGRRAGVQVSAPTWIAQHCPVVQLQRDCVPGFCGIDGQANGFTNSLLKESTRNSVYSYEVRNSLSSKSGTRNAGPKDTVVYTRTYVENSKSPKDGYQENISGKYIQTVYSTSDRSVIERDMCTYCRKPLGVETKMILDELQICCHSTCFKLENRSLARMWFSTRAASYNHKDRLRGKALGSSEGKSAMSKKNGGQPFPAVPGTTHNPSPIPCEICKRPLENLQAGDSIWIYRQTIHCEPCYSKVMDKMDSIIPIHRNEDEHLL